MPWEGPHTRKPRAVQEGDPGEAGPREGRSTDRSQNSQFFVAFFRGVFRYVGLLLESCHASTMAFERHRPSQYAGFCLQRSHRTHLPDQVAIDCIGATNLACGHRMSMHLRWEASQSSPPDAGDSSVSVVELWRKTLNRCGGRTTPSPCWRSSPATDFLVSFQKVWASGVASPNLRISVLPRRSD